MGEGRKELSAEQIRFICQECNITEKELFAFDDDELYDRVYEVMCDIEIAEIPDNDEPEGERCMHYLHVQDSIRQAAIDKFSEAFACEEEPKTFFELVKSS